VTTDQLRERVKNYRLLSAADMKKYEVDFIEQVLLPYWMACFENKEFNDDMCLHLFPFKCRTDADIEEASALEREGSILWVHTHDTTGDEVNLCGWWIENLARRQYAQQVVYEWINQKLTEES
jgi:hypothetical protein